MYIYVCPAYSIVYMFVTILILQLNAIIGDCTIGKNFVQFTCDPITLVDSVSVSVILVNYPHIAHSATTPLLTVL